MPKIYECLNTRSDITQLKKLDNGLVAMCTNMHGAKLFSYDECKVSTNISNENLNSSTTSVDFSNNGKLMAFSTKSSIFIMDIKDKKIIKTIKTDNETITMLAFDEKSKYIIAATKSARVLQYRYDGLSTLGRLYSFEPDQNHSNNKEESSIINSFAFYKNLMACGGRSGRLCIINIHSKANKIVIKNALSSVNSICFLDNYNIVSGDAKGVLHFNSLRDGKLIKQLQTGFTKINQIVLMPSHNYIMVSGDAEHLSIYDVNNFKLLHNKYIKFDDVVSKIIVTDEETLLVVLKNRDIKKIQLSNSSKLKSLIVHNSLDKAFMLVEKNYMLKDTIEYKKLEEAYQILYDQALEALTNQNKHKILEFTNMFKHIESKKEDVTLLTKAFENYPRFKTLYIEKKYALAYNMAEKLPPLQKTFQYKKIEEAWKEVFMNAQRQIAHGRIDNAKTLLNDYATVMQKRPIINLVLKHNSDFLKFLKAMESKNFQKIHKIAEENELFTQLPSYKNIYEEINKSLDEIQTDIDRSELDSAIKKIAKLQNINSIKSKLETLIVEYKEVHRLQILYKANDFIKCYEMIDIHNPLNFTDIGILLQNHWLKIISECESFALQGNIKDIKETLGELIHITTRKDKIGDLFRVSFHTRIKILLAKKIYQKAESFIYSYIDIFGLDNEIAYIMKTFEKISKSKLAITHNQDSRLSRNHWINSEIIMGS